MSDSGGSHILVFPYPAQGHMIPLLDLTYHLASSDGRLTITILVTPQNLRLIRPLLSAHPSTVSPLVLPFPPHPDIPDGVENNVDLPASAFRSMMHALSGLRGPILDWFRAHPSPPTAIVSDMFLGWTHRLAQQLGIPRYAFFPSGAFAVSFINALWRQIPRRRNPADDCEPVKLTDDPNFPIHPWWQLSPIFRSYVEGDPVSEFIRDLMLCNYASHGLIFNTFRWLEGPHLDDLAKRLGHNRIWPVGPVLPFDLPSPAERGGPSSIPPNKIQAWLDACGDHTVVYVCFGSQAVLSNAQMKELTLGLEKSRVKFILSIKSAMQGHANGADLGSVPSGFEDRVAGQGLVIKGWAPQVLILQHRAVAAFLTHCGWNSTIESIVAGVPMIAWPMGADQYLDADLIVDQLGVGVRGWKGAKMVPDSEDVARLLVEATGDEWEETRGRAVALSRAARDGVKKGGSWFESLDGLVSDLKIAHDSK